MAQSKGDESLTRQGKGFTVPASPFNAVKLDLALIVIVGGVLWVVHDHLVTHPFGQFLLLSGYGLIAMCWIVFRTRRISARLAPDAGVGKQGSELDHGEKE